MILTGTVFDIALGRTRKSISLRDAKGAFVCVLLPVDLAPYLEAGYEVHGEKRRVRYLCPPQPQRAKVRELPFEECWRNTEAAVISLHACQISEGIESRWA